MKVDTKMTKKLTENFAPVKFKEYDKKFLLQELAAINTNLLGVE